MNKFESTNADAKQDNVFAVGAMSVADPLRELISADGKSLEAISFDRPQLVVFLRHFGCTFCREALSDLAEKRDQIERLGCRITLIHMSDDDAAEAFFSSYGLGDVSRISDSTQTMYRMFGLDRGSLWQLFGIKVWIRGLVAGLFSGHGLGVVRDNPYQMPGVFVLNRGRIVTGFQHDSASDRPDYIGLIRAAITLEPANLPAPATSQVEFQPTA